MVRKRYCVFSVLCWTVLVQCEMEPFIVGGQEAETNDYAHSVFLSVGCLETQMMRLWICGASILNEKIMLTAAHCTYGCGEQSKMYLFVGSINRKKGTSTSVASYVNHQNYNPTFASYDIGLLTAKTDLILSENVKRVALMRDPPYFEEAQLAGWGSTHEFQLNTSILLKYVNQYVWKNEICKQVISQLPKGSICASSKDPHSYAAIGDSGNALMVRGYIQIGLVSYRMPYVSKSLTVYTDTGYFYDWIHKYSRSLYCVSMYR